MPTMSHAWLKKTTQGFYWGLPTTITTITTTIITTITTTLKAQKDTDNDEDSTPGNMGPVLHPINEG